MISKPVLTLLIDFHGFALIFTDFNGFVWFRCDFYEFGWICMRFHGFRWSWRGSRGRMFDIVWRRCGTGVMAPKEEMLQSSKLFYFLKSNYVRVLEARGLAESVLISTPYSVREWCRFFIKLLSLLSKSDCFQPVSFGVPGTPNSVAEGCQLLTLLV